MPKGEVITTAIIYDALRQGKQIFVPFIYNSKVQARPQSRPRMNMVSLRSKSDYEGLEHDAWAIPSVAEGSVAERSRILEDLGESFSAVSQGFTNSENKSRSRSTESKRLDLIVMPGVAFDGGLGRLGHGKGFYDYFLKRYHDSEVSLLEKETRMPFLGACQGFLILELGLPEPHLFLLVGLALDMQLLQGRVPTDASDWRLDALVVGDGSVIRS